jgi:hypothetical protein
MSFLKKDSVSFFIRIKTRSKIPEFVRFKKKGLKLKRDIIGLHCVEEVLELIKTLETKKILFR